MRLSEQVRERIELGGLILGLLLMAGALRYYIVSDGMLRYRMLEALIERNRLLSIPYSMMHPLAAAPLYLLGKYLFSSDLFCKRFNLLVFAGMLFVLYRRLRPHMEASLLRHWFLILAFCSMFPHHLTHFFTEVFSVSLTVAGLACLLTGATVAGAIALVIATINIPACLVPLALIAAKLAWEGTQGQRKPAYLLIPALALLGILLEAWIRRGNPFLSGYENNVGNVTLLPYSGMPGFSYPFVLGVVSILFSSGKGLLFFTPGLFLKTQSQPLPPTVTAPDVASTKSVEHLEAALLPRLQTLLLLYVVGLILVYARWWAWYGGWFWGPRFFLFACVPASLFLALRLRESEEDHVSLHANLLTLLALFLSAWVGIEGALFGQAGLEFLQANRNALESMAWYVPEFSPLWHPLLQHPPMLIRDKILLLYCLLVTLWLALPLVRRITTQLTDAGRDRVHS